MEGARRRPEEQVATDWLRALKRRRVAFVPAGQQDDQTREAASERQPPLPCPVAASVSVAGCSGCVLSTVPDGVVDNESSAQGDELVLLSWLSSTCPWSRPASDPSGTLPPTASPRRILQISGDGIAAIGIAAQLGRCVQTVVLTSPHLAGRRASQQP